MTPIHHHIYHHVKKHHKKYVFAGTLVAWFYAITKILVLFATSFALFSGSHGTSFADTLPLDSMPQDTWIVNTGVADTGNILSGDVDLSFLLWSGADLSGDVNTGDSNTWALLDLIALHVGQSFGTGTNDTGSVDNSTGNSNTGNIIPSSWSSDTGTSYYENLLASQVVYCHTGDVLMSTVQSGQTFGGITSFQWTLSGWCIVDNLSFQLYDHNHQWIEIAQLSGSNIGFSFDSHFLQNGWYAMTGINSSGEVYTISSGLYSGVSSSFWTGYKIRIVNQNGEMIYRGPQFTIDNQAQTLTGLYFIYSGSSSTGSVHFLFSGNKLMNYVNVSLSTGAVINQTVSGMAYDYIIGGFGKGFSGVIGYTVSFADIFGNTGLIAGTGYLSFVWNSGTGTVLSIFESLKQEISKFNQCKSTLTYKPISLDIDKNVFKLNMPNFQKEDTKKLVNAFSSVMIKKINGVHSLSQNEVDDITKTYNNFLIVLKLVRDDDNECKQNLGNYYMGLFKSTMENYGITNF